MAHSEKNMTKSTLIVGANSGIGSNLAKRLAALPHKLFGTITSDYSRKPNERYEKVYVCNLESIESIDKFVTLYGVNHQWDNLIMCPASMEPIGSFEQININDWLKTFNLNFSSQVYLLNKLLSHRNKAAANVLFFAGGGVNSAPKDYSCYTTSKIALIKLVELLDNEMSDVTFSILGPGWVKTKIHQQSLREKLSDLSSYKETRRRLEEGDFIDMNKVVDSICWILDQPKHIVGGRNFSTEHDLWGSSELNDMLLTTPDAYKLRRYANSPLASETWIQSTQSTSH